MKKRGQGEVIKYLIIAVMIIIITFFGYTVIKKIMEKSCSVQLAKFEIDLSNLDKSVKFGSVKEFTKNVPCSADEIYFFDLDQDISLDFLDSVPLLKDNIQSKAQKNVFLLKNDELIHSFYAGNLLIEDPYYICFNPRLEKINFLVKGQGAYVSIAAGDLQPECG